MKSHLRVAFFFGNNPPEREGKKRNGFKKLRLCLLCHQGKEGKRRWIFVKQLACGFPK